MGVGTHLGRYQLMELAYYTLSPCLFNTKPRIEYLYIENTEGVLL